MSLFACSDIHGYYSIYEQIKNFVQPEDRIYCLGDSGDRGPHSYKTLKTIYNDPQFINIMGNHEKMLIDAWLAYQEGYCGHEFQLLVQNGGHQTIEDLLLDPEAERLINKLRKTSQYVRVTCGGRLLHLTHAGMNPWDENHWNFLWDRDHYFYEYDSDLWENHENEYVIHGHTPIQCLRYELALDSIQPPQPLWYCDGRKCCIDLGTYSSGYAALLNLETFEHHLFHVDGDIEWAEKAPM